MPSRDTNDETDADDLTDPTSSYSIAASDRPSEAVITAVAAETGRDPLELPQLYAAVDPDALDALFEDSRGGTGEIVVSLTYAGYTVRVTGDIIELRDRYQRHETRERS